MAPVVMIGTSILRLWPRLWAAVAMLCVISVMAVPAAAAAEVRSDLQSRVVTVAESASPSASDKDHQQRGAPVQGHCALCCAYTSPADVPSAVLEAPFILAADKALALPASVFVRLSQPDTHDQPPRA